MVYLWIFLGLILGCILLGIANIILGRVKRKRATLQDGKEDNK